jgi:glycosyltransferase involved in cell wall biosynthesis
MRPNPLRRALLISENAPVPADRRVWNECRTLRGAGWEVAVVCPRGRDQSTASEELIEGIEIHRYPLRPADSALGYLREYAQAMVRIRRLVRRLARAQKFDVVHAANPPDCLLLVVRFLRRSGTRFVFDHHDLVPELYRSRFGAGEGLTYCATRLLEALAFRLADVSIATNDSYRRIAIGRGRMPPEDVFVVRNGPDLKRFRPTASDPALRRGRNHLLAYVGVMGPQDGIDHALRALAHLRRRRSDWHAVFVGDGDAMPSMVQLAASLGLAHAAEFVGWRGDADITRILCSADVCLAPDPPNELNEHSTMIKIGEYLAMGRAVASYDLEESRVSAGAAACYALPGDPLDLAECIDRLLSDPQRRARMGRLGRERVEKQLAWKHAEPQLLAAYDRALAKRGDGRERFASGGTSDGFRPTRRRVPAAPNSASERASGSSDSVRLPAA